MNRWTQLATVVFLATVTPAFAQWSQTGGGPPIYYNSGKVGIGTSTPQALLSVGPHSQFGTTTGLLVSPDLDGSPANEFALQVSPFLTAVPSGTSVILYVVSHIDDDLTIPVQYGILVDPPQASGNENHGLTTTYYPGVFMGGNVGIDNSSPVSDLQIGPNNGYGTTKGLLVAPNMIGDPELSVNERAVHIAPVQTADNIYGANILLYAVPTAASGITVTNQYGLYAEAPQGSGTYTHYYPGVFMGGNVGIGTSSPSHTLDVVGDGYFTGTLHGSHVGLIDRDLAEWVNASGPVTPGTVVILNPAKIDEVMPSTRPYDTRVAGVVSEHPGITLGEGGANKAQIATTGRVRVRVDATRAPIAIGDLLVTGSKPGTAIKSKPIVVNGIRIHRPGTLIGKALEPLQSGTKEILVLLSLQ